MTAEQLAKEKYPKPEHYDLMNAHTHMYRELEQKAFISGYNTDRWIRVEDRLPEFKSDDVLVWGELYKTYYPLVAWYSDSGNFIFEDNIINVTHWQPIIPPKP